MSAGLIAENIALLRQGIELLEELNPGLYTRELLADGRRRGVGPQIRHCLDFFANFLDGFEAGRVDYDARQRDEVVESDRQLAAQRMEGHIERLRMISPEAFDTALDVRLDSPDTWARSSVGRELQALVSHTVHHYALIAQQLRANGYEPGPDFGVAPSTLRYQRDLDRRAG